MIDIDISKKLRIVKKYCGDHTAYTKDRVNQLFENCYFSMWEEVKTIESEIRLIQ